MELLIRQYFAMLFHGDEQGILTFHEKNLDILLIAYHKVIKNMCMRYLHDSCHSCVEKVNLSYFKQFVARKTLTLALSLFDSESPFRVVYEYYSRFYINSGSKVKMSSLEKYQILDVLDSILSAVIKKTSLHKIRTELRPRRIGPVLFRIYSKQTVV